MKNTVLLIENDHETVEQAAAALEGLGYFVVGADSAQEGTDKAVELTPALMLINLATPGSNGLELCKTIHNTEGLTEVPIILLTLREGKFEPVYTKLYGIVSFLKKPFQADELVAIAQEHAPVVEDEPEADEVSEDSLEDFGDMEVAMDEDTSNEGVFSIDDAEQSLDDMQESFSSQLDDDSGTATEDEFEGTQQFNLGEMDSGDDATTEDAGGDWGAMDSSDDATTDDAGGDLGTIGSGDDATVEDAGSDWGAMDSGDDATADDAGGDWGAMDSGDDATVEDAGGDLGTMDSGDDAVADDAGGDLGTLDSGDDAAADDAGSDWGAMDSGDDATTEDAGGDWGEMDSGDDAAADDAGGDWGAVDSGDDATTEDAAVSATADDDAMDDADSTLKMELDQSGWDKMDIDDSEGTIQMDTDASDESAPSDDDFTVDEDFGDAFGSDDSTDTDSSEETGEPMVDDTPTFDDEPFGDDESFTDDSMGADEDMPQMDMEDEDYSDLFDGDQEESESTGKKKKKKKKDKKKKGAKAGGKSPLKRILILVLLLLVLGGGGFAAYTFFLAEEPTTKVTVKRRPATRQQAPKLDDEIPADLLKDIEQEEAAMKKAEKIEPVKAVIPETKKTVEKRQTTKTTVRKKTRTKQEPIKAAVSVATGAYYVQFGAFGSSANAARMEKRLKKAGMDTLIKQKATRAGKTINYVLLNEPYKSSKEASQTASQIKRTTGYDTAVFRNR